MRRRLARESCSVFRAGTTFGCGSVGGLVKKFRLGYALLVLLVGLGVASPAWAWGCEGHQVIALIAEKNLTPHARSMAMKILAASPISPDLRRHCGKSGLDAFVDSSTWADDERTVQPQTGPWHYIDIPLGVSHGSLRKYCPSSTGCVASAIRAQLAVLRNPRATAKERADALRYAIHFVGDLHQPLHTVTNDDLGGNCVPVTFQGRIPQETNVKWGTYSPNLHAVWDYGIIELYWAGLTPQQVADRLENRYEPRIAAWKSQPIDVTAWIWQSHRLAQTVAYGRLPVKIPLQTPQPVTSCNGDNHVSTRMLKLHETLAATYMNAATATIQVQLARAGARLAAVLNSLWP